MSNKVLRNTWLVVVMMAAVVSVANICDMVMTANWSKWWICFGYCLLFFGAFRLYRVYRYAVRHGNLYGQIRIMKQHRRN